MPRACAKSCRETSAAARAISRSSRPCSTRARPTSPTRRAHEDGQLVHRQPDRASGRFSLLAVSDRRTSAQDKSLLFEEQGTNLAIKFRAVRGDAAAAFKDAPYVRSESFRVQRHMAMPMETRGLLAEWDAARGRLTVNGGAKVLFFNRRTLAKQLGLAEDAIDIVENDVGGGFGARGEFYP